MLNLVQFGPRKIFRPSPQLEESIRLQARKHLDSKFEPGIYCGGERANSVILHQFKFYETLFEMVLPSLGSRDEVDFLFYQYDQATALFHGEGILDLREREAWSKVEPHFKRGIKYLLERLCMRANAPPRRTSREQSMVAMSIAVSCSEQLTHLAQESDLVHSIFPDDVAVTVFPSGPPDFKIKATGKYEGWADRLYDRMRRDRDSRREIVEWPVFDYHTATHQAHLDQPFAEAFGASYGHFIEVIRQTIEGCQPSLHPNAFPTLFVPYEKLVNEIIRESSLPMEVVKRALAGFTITAENLKNEGRAVFKPKQKHRALRRGFFLMPHADGPHLAFSKSMALENLAHFCGAVAYQKLPPEWSTRSTMQAAVNLSAAAGRWFEGQVLSRLNQLGIIGGRASRKVGQGSAAIPIPSSVGEIDFLGIDPKQNLLVVVEAKMVKGGVEPAFWRNELEEFVRRPGCYTEQFRKKVAWVSENRRAIAAVLGGDFEPKVGMALVTLYPTIAQEFISDIMCVTLTELVLDHQRAGGWPYALI